MNRRWIIALRPPLKVITASGVALQLTARSAHADKVWFESDNTIVQQSISPSGLPNEETCLFKTSVVTDDNGGIATFGFNLLRAMPISPFSYADKAAQWSNNELVQLQVDGNKPIMNNAHIDDHNSLSGLLTIPSSHLAAQMLNGHTLTVSTRAGARTFSIPANAMKAFQQCVRAVTRHLSP